MIDICLIFCIAEGSIILRRVIYIQTTQCTYLHTHTQKNAYMSQKIYLDLKKQRVLYDNNIKFCFQKEFSFSLGISIHTLSTEKDTHTQDQGH
jgi:hypothetical protein